LFLHGLFGNKRNLSNLARQLNLPWDSVLLDMRNHGTSRVINSVDTDQTDFYKMASDVLILA